MHWKDSACAPKILTVLLQKATSANLEESTAKHVFADSKDLEIIGNFISQFLVSPQDASKTDYADTILSTCQSPWQWFE